VSKQALTSESPLIANTLTLGSNALEVEGHPVVILALLIETLLDQKLLSQVHHEASLIAPAIQAAFSLQIPIAITRFVQRLAICTVEEMKCVPRHHRTAVAGLLENSDLYPADESVFLCVALLTGCLES
jgi:hypothetical protein